MLTVPQMAHAELLTQAEHTAREQGWPSPDIHDELRRTLDLGLEPATRERYFSSFLACLCPQAFGGRPGPLLNLVRELEPGAWRVFSSYRTDRANADDAYRARAFAYVHAAPANGPVSPAYPLVVPASDEAAIRRLARDWCLRPELVLGAVLEWGMGGMRDRLERERQSS